MVTLLPRLCAEGSTLVRPLAAFRRLSVMSSPLSPPSVKGSGVKELPAYLSNGVVGLRVRDNPLVAGMALVCGYSGLHSLKRIEAAAVAPYPLAGNIALNGVWLSDLPHQVTVLEQAYDFANGELTSRFSFEAQGVKAEIEILTFCCRHQPTLVVQEIAVRTDAACDLKLQASIDPAAVPGVLREVAVETPGGGNDFDGSLLWESEGGFSSCGLALVTELLGDETAEREKPGAGPRSPVVTQYGLRTRASKTYRLRQIASLVPSAIHSHPNRHAERLAALGVHQGLDNLQKANRSEWRELWKGRILLHGAGRKWQQLSDAAFFYMNTSVHAGSPAGESCPAQDCVPRPRRSPTRTRIASPFLNRSARRCPRRTSSARMRGRRDICELQRPRRARAWPGPRRSTRRRRTTRRGSGGICAGDNQEGHRRLRGRRQNADRLHGAPPAANRWRR